MKFFKDSNGFTEEEVNHIMQATSAVRHRIVKDAYSDIMQDSIFIKILAGKYNNPLIKSEDEAIFLLSIGSETIRGCDSRDRYLLYYQNSYYFFSTGCPESFIYGTEESAKYYVPGYQELLPAHFLKYTEEELQKIREKNQYYNQDNELIIPIGISFYVDTPIKSEDKFHIQDLLREMFVELIKSSSWPSVKQLTYHERAYIEDVSDYVVNTVSFSR